MVPELVDSLRPPPIAGKTLANPTAQAPLCLFKMEVAMASCATLFYPVFGFVRQGKARTGTRDLSKDDADPHLKVGDDGVVEPPDLEDVRRVRCIRLQVLEDSVA